MGKYDHIDFKPTKSMIAAAKRGLEYRKRNGGHGGLTAEEAAKSGHIGSGVQRASNIINSKSLSPATVRMMHGFFSRHEKNKKIDKGKKAWEDKGYVAWLLWGGDAGAAWSRKIVKQMDSADKKKKAEIIKSLVKIANHLDYIGLYEEATKIDNLVANAVEPEILGKPQIVNETYKQQKKYYKKSRKEIEEHIKDRQIEQESLRNIFADNIHESLSFLVHPSDIFVNTYEKLKETHIKTEIEFVKMFKEYQDILNDIGDIKKIELFRENTASIKVAKNNTEYKAKLIKELKVLDYLINKINKEMTWTKQRVKKDVSSAFHNCVINWLETIEEAKRKYYAFLVPENEQVEVI